MSKRRTNIFDEIMAERIACPGFPQLIVTRGWLYQWLKSLGWNPSELGYGSLDATVFLPRPMLEEEATAPDVRDFWLGKVQEDFRRETVS